MIEAIASAARLLFGAVAAVTAEQEVGHLVSGLPTKEYLMSLPE